MGSGEYKTSVCVHGMFALVIEATDVHHKSQAVTPYSAVGVIYIHNAKYT